jgi:hypothetical protein
VLDYCGANDVFVLGGFVLVVRCLVDEGFEDRVLGERVSLDRGSGGCWGVKSCGAVKRTMISVFQPATDAWLYSSAAPMAVSQAWRVG